MSATIETQPKPKGKNTEFGTHLYCSTLFYIGMQYVYYVKLYLEVTWTTRIIYIEGTT